MTNNLVLAKKAQILISFVMLYQRIFHQLGNEFASLTTAYSYYQKKRKNFFIRV
jgi:hypothetical protein